MGFGGVGAGVGAAHAAALVIRYTRHARTYKSSSVRRREYCPALPLPAAPLRSPLRRATLSPFPVVVSGSLALRMSAEQLPLGKRDYYGLLGVTFEVRAHTATWLAHCHGARLPPCRAEALLTRTCTRSPPRPRFVRRICA